MSAGGVAAAAAETAEISYRRGSADQSRFDDGDSRIRRYSSGRAVLQTRRAHVCTYASDPANRPTQPAPAAGATRKFERAAYLPFRELMEILFFFPFRTVTV